MRECANAVEEKVRECANAVEEKVRECANAGGTAASPSGEVREFTFKFGIGIVIGNAVRGAMPRPIAIRKMDLRWIQI